MRTYEVDPRDESVEQAVQLFAILLLHVIPILAWGEIWYYDLSTPWGFWLADMARRLAMEKWFAESVAPDLREDFPELNLREYLRLKEMIVDRSSRFIKTNEEREYDRLC